MSIDPENRVVRTICQECHAGCGMDVYVERGRAVRVEAAPDSRGASKQFCAKAATSLERLYSPGRLLHPLKRAGEKGDGRWYRISWDEALDVVAQKFREAKEAHGAESVALTKGMYSKTADYVSRLGNVFGTPNVASIDNTCYIPSASGRLMTYGFDGMPDIAGGPECLLCWGNSADPPRAGTKLIVVNALPTRAAKRADVWLRPRPGTDLALALGMLNVIIAEKLYDRDFVDHWTIGFADLEEHVRRYPPERVAEITWVPAADLIDAARLFARARPACLWNGNASEDIVNSTQCARAFSIIQAICGALDVPGGTRHIEGSILVEGTGRDIMRHALSAEQDRKKLGADAGYFPPHELWDPIVWKPVEVRPHHIVDAILDGEPYPVKVLAVFASNPVLTWSNSRRVVEALKKLDFLVVSDLFMTPTAALADIVLPAASYLEKDAVLVKAAAGVSFLEPQRKVVQVGECRPDLEILSQLAWRLGLGEYFAPDMAALLDRYLDPMGITFAELCRRPGVVSSTTKYRKYLENGFNTPSGKVELRSSLCEQWGYEPLPVYHEPEETPFSAPAMLAEYPLVVTSAHEAEYMHSQGRALPGARQKRPWPLTTIHPDTAAALGICEGDQVYIENLRGRIKQRATIDAGIDPRVVSVGYGWWYPERTAPPAAAAAAAAGAAAAGAPGAAPAADLGPAPEGAAAPERELATAFEFVPMPDWEEANINILTDDGPPYSPEIGSPKMRGFLCRVHKAAD